MRSAYSAIFSTAFSGLGYGLLVLLGLMGAPGLIVAERDFGIAVFALALAAVTLSLLASGLHPSHPGRAWRALSQWRTSWTSREGIAALATYLAAGIFALGWIVFGRNGGPWALAGIICAAGALITIACSGMVYASLPAISAWSNRWTVPAYLTLGLASGSLWLAALSRLFAVDWPAITHLPLALVLAAWIIKTFYWAGIDKARAATEPGEAEQMVHPPAKPHTRDDLVIERMDVRITRKHAVRLRRTTVALAFLVPLVLTELMMFLPGSSSSFVTATAFAGALSGTAGVLLERWLFFAEARHVVTLYHDTGSN